MTDGCYNIKHMLDIHTLHTWLLFSWPIFCPTTGRLCFALFSLGKSNRLPECDFSRWIASAKPLNTGTGAWTDRSF